MTATETHEVTEDHLVQMTIIDPETDAEIVFRAETEEELESQIDAYFEPSHEANDGDSIA